MPVHRLLDDVAAEAEGVIAPRPRGIRRVLVLPVVVDVGRVLAARVPDSREARDVEVRPPTVESIRTVGAGNAEEFEAEVFVHAERFGEDLISVIPV